MNLAIETRKSETVVPVSKAQLTRFLAILIPLLPGMSLINFKKSCQ